MFWQRLGFEEACLNTHTLDVLDEALTHTSAGRVQHHEQLEFLGDAVLRLAASDFIACEYPRMPVGERSTLRAQLVSDRWLAELGAAINIENVVLLGAKAHKDQAARATLRAEHSEALIGAIYRISGTVDAVHAWLTPFWQETSQELLTDPHRGNSKSALQEWTQAQKMGLPHYFCEESSQQHGDPNRFHCRVLLQEKELGNGYGRSRKQAEQAAARQALQSIQPNKRDSSETGKGVPQESQ